MAITITALSPAKNATDVAVGSDVTLTLTSDSYDLDITTTTLSVNGVDVQPSAYYGENTAEVTDVTLPAGSALAVDQTNAFEETKFETLAGSTLSGGEYFTFSSTATNYYMWCTIDATGADPAPGGTGVVVALLSTDTAAGVASKVAAALDAIGGGTVFNSSSEGDDVTLTNLVAGDTTDLADNDFGLAEINVSQGGVPGYYWTLNITGDVQDTYEGGTEYYVWYYIDNEVDPQQTGTGVQVTVLAGDTAAQVATKTATALDALAPFNVPAPGADTITVTNVDGGLTTDATVGTMPTGIAIAVTTQGLSNKAVVDVSFYPRKRIKYNTKKYGEDNFRYGQKDLFPSAFQYGYRYTFTVTIQDTNGLSFTENFSFTIEDGIFYTSLDLDSFYYPQTQAVANYTPAWARARYDKYSNFQQFVNAPGRFLQEIEDSLFKQNSDYYVQTADLNDLSTLYKVELGGDFEFQTTVLDDGTRLQIPPEIIATKDITKYEPLAEFRNDVKSFFYEKLPSRLDETKEDITDLVIQAKTLATDKLITLDRRLDREGYISITIEDGTQFTQVNNNDFTFLFLRIRGESRERKEQVEDLVIIDNDTYYTSKLWRSIESIQFINLPQGSPLSYTLDHARPLRSFVADSFSHITASDEDKSTFWKAVDTTYGTTLQQWVLLESNPEDIISSLGQKDLITEFELLDVDGTTNLNLLDIDVDIFGNYIYGIDQNNFYIFDKRETYPSVIRQLPETNSTADFIIELDTDDLGRGDTVKTIIVTGIQKVIGKQIAKYRLGITKPDDSVDYIMSDGTLESDKTLASNLGDINTLQFQTTSFTYDLDILGDYVIKLEAVYRDGTTSVDSKIARLHTKPALVKYSLGRIFNNIAIKRMFVDFDQQVKILDSNKQLHTLRFAKDNVLIDYTNAILYFNEDYEEVEA
jgi:hypothetical protein